MTNQFVSEEDVLQPYGEGCELPEDGPSFTLHEVTVISQTTGEPVSLLAANADNRLTVRGKLQEIGEQHGLVRDQSYASHIIQVQNVMRYAYAECSDGGFVFWAGGKAGWFEIEEPLPSYKSIYDDMGVAVSMLYFLSDKMAKSRKSDFTNSQFVAYIKYLFKEYYAASKDHARFADAADVREGFHHHREFLIKSMLLDGETSDWANAPMLKYFRSEFPDDVARITQSLGQIDISKTVPINLERAEKGSSTSRNINPEGSSMAQGRGRRGRPPKSSIESDTIKTPSMQEVISSSSSGSEDEDDFRNLDAVMRKRKSILQPSGSKYASKTARKSIDRHGTRRNDMSEQDQRALLAKSPITTIKTVRDLLAATDPEAVTASGTPTSSPFIPRRYLRLRALEYEVPSLLPQGPGDLWTCTFEGCSHRVHKASSAKGKSQIREHIEEHRVRAQEKIALAMNECRPYLPVNNLVRRLQAVDAGPNSDGNDLNSLGRKFSAPIRQKY